MAIQIPVREQIISQLDRLAPDQQRQVLDFVNGLTRPRGESGDDIIRAAQGLGFSSQDLAEMERAIEEDCEQVNPDGW